MPTPAQVQSNRAQGLPDWYTPDPTTQTQPANTNAPSQGSVPLGNPPAQPAQQPAQAPQAAPLPDWLTQMDANDPAAKAPLAKQGTAPAAPQATPHSQAAWDAVDPAPVAPPAPQATPDWLQKMDAQAAWDAVDPAQPSETVTVNGYRPTDWDDVKSNIATGLARIPGAVLGAPQMINHTMDWLIAQAGNTLGLSKGATGVDVDRYNPGAYLPSSQDIDNGVFKVAGAVAGRPITPYDPTSIGGKLGQAAITGIGAGLLDPAADVGMAKSGASFLRSLLTRGASAVKTGVASSAAEGTQQLFPDTPALAGLTAFLAHAGTSAGMSAARLGGGATVDAVRQVVSPTAQGTREAGTALAGIDNTRPGLATPTASDISGATSDTKAATDAIGPGLPDWQAGANLRASLQQRVAGLEQARQDATAPLLAARDSSPNPINTDPVFAAIDNKLRVAAGAQQDALLGARSDLSLADGLPRDEAEQLAATRTAINARINTATRAGDNASASHLLDIRNVLDDQINKSVPEAGQYTSTYAAMSKPLDPTQSGPVAQVLDRDQFNSRNTFPDERIPDLFLRSNATRADLGQLTAAFGDDKVAATAALQDHLAGVAQRAVNPDGTLDQGAFDKAMAPYQKSLGNLSMYFPDLAAKFSNAKAAQGTLDTLQAQRGISDAVAGGALRDNTGVVTGASFGKWLRSNQEAISKTQSPGAAMRLQSIGSALQNVHPGELADALKSEWAPTALGMATGGLEGGVLGTLLHKSTQAVFGGLDAKRQAAFSAAIEQATLDPDYAARISANAAKRAGGVSPIRGLVRAIAATPLAVNAGKNRYPSN